MIACLKDDNKIHLDLLTQDIEDRIIETFSVKDPQAQFSSAFEMGHWNGMKVFYSRRYKTLSIAFLDRLIKLCKKHDIPLDVEDERSAPTYYPIPKEKLTSEILNDGPKGIILGPHQMRCCESMYVEQPNSMRGIHSHPTGSGKTEMMAAIIKMFPGCPTVLIAEERIVAQQIEERLELRKVAGHSDSIGAFYAGKRPDGQIIVVGSIQALQKPPESARKKELKRTGSDKAWVTRNKNADYLQKVVAKCHMVLIDECDRASSDLYKLLFDKWAKNAKRFYGFTGTPFEKSKPVENMRLISRFGEIISESTREEMLGLGRVIPVSYTMIAVGQDGNKADKTNNNDAKKVFMEENEELHNTIKKVCKINSHEGTLILVEREAMGKVLESIIPSSKFIFGKTPMKARNAAIDDFENRKLKVLIGSKILMRGLDLDGGTENLILCYDGKSESELIQRIGRALRKNKVGKSKVYDFLFLCNHYLYKHSRARLKTVAEAGHPSNVVFPKTGIKLSGEALIKRNWRIPKK